MTGFAVAWGIFILVVLLGASNGFRNGIQKFFGDRVTNMLTIEAGWTSLPYKGLKKERDLFFTEREAKVLSSLPEVDLFAVGADKWNMNVNYRNQYSSVELKAIRGDYWEIYRKTILKGRYINRLDDQRFEKVCVLNSRAAEELMTEDLVGKYIQVGGIMFRVVGLCKSTDRWDEATIYIPLSTYFALYEPKKHIDAIMLVINEKADYKRKKVNPGEPWNDSSPFEDKIRKLLAPMMQFDPADQRALWIQNSADDYDTTKGVMSAIWLFVLIIGLCTLVSGAVGVSNIMLVSVKERTKEFGIRKAIGAPPRTILLTVVGESVLISALFGYIGMLFGIGIMEVVNMIVSNVGTEIPFVNPTVDIPVVVTATLILVIVGVIAGAIPAVRAVRIKPIEAMNAEK